MYSLFTLSLHTQSLPLFVSAVPASEVSKLEHHFMVQVVQGDATAKE